MAGPAVLFREIHRLRRFAQELKEQLDRFSVQVKAQQAKVKRQEDGRHDENESIKKLKVAIHEQEVSLKANNAQIKKYEGQLSEISSKKEYDALLAEIAASRKKSQQLEDEILAAMTEVEERTAKLPEFEQNVARAQQEFARWEKTAKGRQVEQAAELSATLEKLKAADAKVDEKVRQQYSRMVASMGHEAMAAVKNRTCSHCSVEITAQSYNDLLQEQFVVCKACGRILYLPEPTSPVV